MYAVGSISGPHLGRFRVNKWSTSFRSIKIVVSEDFSEQVFRGGCKVFVGFWRFGPKPVFSERVWQKFAFAVVCSGGCWWMLLLDYKKGVAQNPIKQVFFATPFLREGKGRKEKRGQRSKNTTTLTPKTMGP